MILFKFATGSIMQGRFENLFNLQRAGFLVIRKAFVIFDLRAVP